MRNKAPDIRILTIRDQKVVLDSELARIYGVPTRTLNQALRRNKKRFPRDFAFQLSGGEYEAMRSEIVIASSVAQDIRSQVVTASVARSMRWQTASTSRRHVRCRLSAFTDRGGLT